MASEAPEEEKFIFAARLDILKNIITEIDANSQLKSIFDGSVLKNLALTVKPNGFGIVDLGPVDLSHEDEEVFLDVLEGILTRNVKKE